MSLVACGPDDPPVTGGEDAGDGGECTSGEKLCGGECVDTSESLDHCGACDVSCEVGDNATAVCNSGTCELECSPRYDDENGDLEDGCEVAICQETNAGVETCDNLDNDCDGIVDNGFDTGEVCNVGVGACANEGQMECSEEGSSTVCSAQPGEPSSELCGTGVDEDCDGEIDEDDASDATTWYVDSDGDGYGDANSTMKRCTKPAGYVDNSDDCDDSDDTINPEADEKCDSVDRNCDGDDKAGAVDMPTWYLDCDGDTFASNTSTTVVQCNTPPKSDAEAQCPDPPLFGSNEWTDTDPTVSEQRDCEDEEPFAHPDQTEYYPEPYMTTDLFGNPIESYDWNCDGSEEMRWTETDRNCGCTCTLQSCPPGQAWVDSSIPPCGNTAELATCSYTVEGFCSSSTENEQQSCR